MAVDSLRAAVRQAKNAVMQFTDVEVKVRDATSNDPWGPTSTLMAEIARATNDYQEYPKLFHRLWSRLNDTEHVMHVQKSLILIDYLLRNGSERFINDCKRRARDIAQLKRFKHYDANNNDDAKEARAKASMVYDLLMNDKTLAEERQKARKIADVKSQGFGAAGSIDSFSTDAYGRRYDDVNNGYGGGGGDEFGGSHDSKGRNSAGSVLDDADEWGRTDSRTPDKPIRKKSAPSKNNDDDDEEDKVEEEAEKKKKKKKKKVKEEEEEVESPVSSPAPISKPKKKAEKKQEEVVEEEEPVEEEEEAPKKEKKKKSKEKEASAAAAVAAADVGAGEKKKKKKKKVEEEEDEAIASSTSSRGRKTVEFASPKSNTSAASSVADDDDPFSPNSSAAAAAASNTDPFAVLPAARHNNNNNKQGGSGEDFLSNLSKSQGGIFDARSDNNGRNGGGGFGDLDILTGGASARSEPTLTDMFAATSISKPNNAFPPSSSSSASAASSHTMFDEKKPAGKNDLWSAASDLTNLDNITQTERLSNRNKKKQQDTDNVMSMAMMRSIQPLGSEKSAAPITMTPTMTTGTPSAMPPPMNVNMNMGMYSAYAHPNPYGVPPNYPNAYVNNMQPYPMGAYPPGGAMPNRSPNNMNNSSNAFFDVPRAGAQSSSTANNNNNAFNGLAWGR